MQLIVDTLLGEETVEQMVFTTKKVSSLHELVEDLEPEVIDVGVVDTVGVAEPVGATGSVGGTRPMVVGLISGSFSGGKIGGRIGTGAGGNPWNQPKGQKENQRNLMQPRGLMSKFIARHNASGQYHSLQPNVTM